MFSGLLDKYRSMPLPAKAGVWFTLCSIIQRGISVISMPIFTRLLTTDAYGTYSLYTSWYMLFSLVVTLNLASEVFNKGLTDHSEERPEYTTSQAALITVLVGAFFVLYLVFRGPINALTGMGTLLTCLMFLDIYSSVVLSLWFARKRFDYAYKQLIDATLFISVASVLLGVACVWAAPDDWKVVARVASNIAPSAVLAIAVWVLFLRDSREFFEREWWGQSIRLGIPLVPHYASQVLLNQADKVMISWFLDNTRVAIYGVAHSAGLLLVMVNNGINSSFVPWLYGNLRKGDCVKVPGVTNVLSLLVTCSSSSSCSSRQSAWRSWRRLITRRRFGASRLLPRAWCSRSFTRCSSTWRFIMAAPDMLPSHPSSRPFSILCLTSLRFLCSAISPQRT